MMDDSQSGPSSSLVACVAGVSISGIGAGADGGAVRSSTIGSSTGVAVRATFDVPFVFRLTRHVFFQVGPQISYLNQLSGQPDLKGFSGGASAGLSLRL